MPGWIQHTPTIYCTSDAPCPRQSWCCCIIVPLHFPVSNPPACCCGKVKYHLVAANPRSHRWVVRKSHGLDSPRNKPPTDQKNYLIDPTDKSARTSLVYGIKGVWNRVAFGSQNGSLCSSGAKIWNQRPDRHDPLSPSKAFPVLLFRFDCLLHPRTVPPLPATTFIVSLCVSLSSRISGCSTCILQSRLFSVFFFFPIGTCNN